MRSTHAWDVQVWFICLSSEFSLKWKRFSFCWIQIEFKYTIVWWSGDEKTYTFLLPFLLNSCLFGHQGDSNWIIDRIDSAIVEHFNKNRVSCSFRHCSTNLSSNRFGCRPLREDDDWETRRVKTHHRWTFQSKDISRIGTCERLERSRDEAKETKGGETNTGDVMMWQHEESQRWLCWLRDSTTSHRLFSRIEI